MTNGTALQNVIYNINHTADFKWDGVPLKVWVIDEIIVSAEDTVSIYFMYVDPYDRDNIIKDKFCHTRSDFATHPYEIVNLYYRSFVNMLSAYGTEEIEI